MRVLCLVLIFLSYQVECSQLHDPTTPPWLKSKVEKTKVEKKNSVKVKERFNLMQIVNHKQGNRAVINGYVLKEGEHIHRARVERIESNNVILVRGDDTWILTLEETPSRVRR